MADKPGFLDRLLGRTATPSPSPEVSPGPPEATPRYVEQVEALQQAPVPAPKQKASES